MPRKSILASLPTLADLSRIRRATPKVVKSRLDAKAEAAGEDARRLKAWRHAVGERDEWRCRRCGIHTIKTLALSPQRGEAAHICRRSDRAVRTDRRNGVHLCHRCHEDLDQHRIRLVGTAAQMFVVEGQSYLDGDCPLRFV